MIYDAGLEYDIKKNNIKIKMLEALKTNISNEVKNSGFTDEQINELAYFIEQVYDKKMTWREAIDSLVQKYRRSD